MWGEDTGRCKSRPCVQSVCVWGGGSQRKRSGAGATGVSGLAPDGRGRQPGGGRGEERTFPPNDGDYCWQTMVTHL